MVLSSLLAASASHIQLLRGTNTITHRLRYRSAAFTELQQASIVAQTDPTVTLAALATILGLLIDDMVAYSKDFSTLLDLARFWLNKDCACYRGDRERATHRFLLNQFQMYDASPPPLN
jgi:hypothetical protein